MSVPFDRLVLTFVCFSFAFSLPDANGADAPAKTPVVKFARFKIDDRIAYGTVEGNTISEISGTIFGEWKKTDKVHKGTPRRAFPTG